MKILFEIRRDFWMSEFESFGRILKAHWWHSWLKIMLNALCIVIYMLLKYISWNHKKVFAIFSFSLKFEVCRVSADIEKVWFWFTRVRTSSSILVAKSFLSFWNLFCTSSAEFWCLFTLNMRIYLTENFPSHLLISPPP